MLRELQEHGSGDVSLLACEARTSCAQKSRLGAPWLIQYLFTGMSSKIRHPGEGR